MSCFVRIATQLVHREAIEQAAEELGYPVLREAKAARGWASRTEKADMVLGTGTNYDIGGVRREDGTWEFVADWSMAHVERDAFVGKLTQRYSVVLVKENARKKGFTVAKEQVEQDGRLVLTLRRFA